MRRVGAPLYIVPLLPYCISFRFGVDQFIHQQYIVVNYSFDRLIIEEYLSLTLFLETMLMMRSLEQINTVEFAKEGNIHDQIEGIQNSIAQGTLQVWNFPSTNIFGFD